MNKIEGGRHPTKNLDTLLVSRSLKRTVFFCFFFNCVDQEDCLFSICSEGLPGRECLLRCICQAAETPLGHNGLVGQLLHILLTPSSSIYEPELNADFLQAEEDGLRGEDCEELYSNCPWKVLEVFTTLDTL